MLFLFMVLECLRRVRLQVADYRLKGNKIETKRKVGLKPLAFSCFFSCSISRTRRNSALQRFFARNAWTILTDFTDHHRRCWAKYFV